MKSLIEKISRYQMAVQGLIDKLNEYETFVKENVPKELWDTFSIGKFKGNQIEDWYLKIDGKYVPNNTNGLGGGKYWYGDFNHWYDAVTGGELIEFSKNLPKLYRDAEEYIDSLSRAAETVSEM
jgi:hypothetical protein